MTHGPSLELNAILRKLKQFQFDFSMLTQGSRTTALKNFCCLTQFRIQSPSFAHANGKVLLVELNAKQSEIENAYDKCLQDTTYSAQNPYEFG